MAEEHAKMLLNDDKKLTACIAPMFKKYDVDGDGTISYDELKSLLKEILEGTFGKAVEVPEKSFKNVFDKVDRDKSGNINKKEIKNFVKAVFILVSQGKIKVP